MTKLTHIYRDRDNEKASRTVTMTPRLLERLAGKSGVFVGENGDRWIPLDSVEAVRASLLDGDTVHTERASYFRED
jgi:hypothetical protein